MAGAITAQVPRMPALRRPAVVALTLIAAGTLLRLILAATTTGNTFDLGSYGIVDQALRDGSPLNLYGPELHVDGVGVSRWPYPPAFLPVILLVSDLASATNLAFERLIRIPSILADAGIAWLVFTGLNRRSATLALAGAATVAFGPSFILNSGVHGQIDSVAILPVVAAVVLWTRPGQANRWLWCGLLIGLGAAVKTPVGVLALALLVTARSPKEALQTAAAAIAVPLALLSPFLLADLSGVKESLGYNGLPGIGGLSLLAQPGLATEWLAGGGNVVAAGIGDALQTINRPLLLAALVATAAVAYRRRIDTPTTAAALVVIVWLAGVNYAMGYAVWGLPFLALAGLPYVSAGLQLLLLAPTLLVELVPRPDGWPETLVNAVFVPSMLAALLVWAVLYVRLLRRP
jgi:hypothetical protein